MVNETILIAVVDYTTELFSSIMATKKPDAKIITPYWAWNLALEKQLQELTGRPDLSFPDFVVAALRQFSGLAVETKHISRAWNLAPEIRKRLGLVEHENAVLPDTTKPELFKTELPLKPVVQKIGNLGVVKSDSVESQVLDMKSKLEELLKKL